MSISNPLVTLLLFVIVNSTLLLAFTAIFCKTAYSLLSTFNSKSNSIGLMVYHLKKALDQIAILNTPDTVVVHNQYVKFT